ncbi:hypothetical protein JG688_00018015, partial [Phytophthora aleatoria]
AEEVGTVCEVARTVGEAPVEYDEVKFWDAVESVSGGEEDEKPALVAEPEVASVVKVDVINEPKDKDESVSFPRMRFAPRLGAAPPLKSALKKLEAVISD